MTDTAAIASLWVDPLLGLLSWTARDSADDPVLRTGQEYLALPIPLPAGKYVCQLAFDSGEPIEGVDLDVWVDASTGPLWYLTNDVINTVKLSTTFFTIAEDDGTGNPVAGTEVTKPVTFRSEWLPADGVLISTTPWSLTDIKVEEEAWCTVRASSDGVLRGIEGGRTAISENFAASDEAFQFTVQYDLVSGPAPDVGQLGVPLAVTSDREVRWNADTVDEIIQAQVDVTVRNPAGAGVTKRVTIYAEQQELDGSQNILDESFAQDIVQARPVEPPYVELTIFVFTDGTLWFGRTNNENNAPSVPAFAFPQDWNSDAPNTADGQIFECRLVNLRSDDFNYYPPSALSDRHVDNDATEDEGWIPITTTRLWVLRQQFESTSQTKNGDWELQIRRAGRPSTVRAKRFSLNVTHLGEDATTGPAPPPDLILPDPPEV